MAETALKNRLHDVLSSLELGDLHVKVQDISARNVIAIVTSENFATMDEAARQRLVWRAVQDEFTNDEQTQIEFIFTNTPEEESNMAQESA